MNSTLRNFSLPKSISDLINKTRSRTLTLVHGITSPSIASPESCAPPTSTSPHLSSEASDSFKMLSTPEFEGQHYLNETPIIQSRFSRSPFSFGLSNTSNPHDSSSVSNPVSSPSSQIHSISPSSKSG